jgi:hypothetical protein
MHIQSLFQYVLALTFLITGGRKLFLPKEKIIANGGGWAENFTEPFIKLIGLIEVIFAVGIGIGRYVWIPPIISFILLVIIMALMLGASYIHYRRKEYPLLTVTLVLFVMALYIWYNYYNYMRSFL